LWNPLERIYTGRVNPVIGNQGFTLLDYTYSSMASKNASSFMKNIFDTTSSLIFQSWQIQ